MSLLEASQSEPSKKPLYIILCVLVVFLIAVFVWWSIRFNTEQKTVTAFFNAVQSGNLQQAYTLWKPSESYTFKDFQDAWGPSGYYGPIKSFEIESASAPRKSDSSVAVTILVSPYQPFPKAGTAEANKTKTVVIWVNRASHSLSFPPPTFSQRARSPLFRAPRALESLYPV